MTRCSCIGKEDMKDETKQMIQLQLGLLKKILKDENVAMGIQINKEDNQKSKICFIDYAEYKQGTYSGITVDLDEFNSQLS